MKEVKTAYNTKMKNKLFGLLCEREKGRDWETFLNSIFMFSLPLLILYYSFYSLFLF